MFLRTIVLTVSSVLFLSVGHIFIRQFNQDPLLLKYGTDYLRIVTYSHIFMGWELVFAGAFSGMANTLPHMWIVAPLTLARIPLAYMLIPYLHINGIFWAISLTTILKGSLLAVWFMYKGEKLMQEIVDNDSR